jgi:hypothetical protein
VSHSLYFFALRPASYAPPSLATHVGNANIRRSQFKLLSLWYSASTSSAREGLFGPDH